MNLKELFKNKSVGYWILTGTAIAALVMAIVVFTTHGTTTANTVTDGYKIAIPLLVGFALQIVFTFFPARFAGILSTVCYTLAFGLTLNRIAEPIADHFNNVAFQGGNFGMCIFYAVITLSLGIASVVACFFKQTKDSSNQLSVKELFVRAKNAVSAKIRNSKFFRNYKLKEILKNLGVGYWILTGAAIAALVMAIVVFATHGTTTANTVTDGYKIAIPLLVGFALQIVFTFFPMRFAGILSTVCYTLAFGLTLNRIAEPIADHFNNVAFQGGNYAMCVFYAVITLLLGVVAVVSCFFKQMKNGKAIV